MVNLRHVIRTFGRKPAVAITAIATLALGVALTTTMFTVVDAVILEPLPFPDPDRLVALYETNSGSGVRDQVSALNFADWQERSRLVESMTIGILESPSFASATVPERITSVRASTSFFDVLAVAPMIGRGFAPEESQSGRGAVVVLSHEFWQSRFHGDPAILGRSVRLDAEPHTVIGVMPPSFRYPDSDVAVWRPLVLRDYELKYREKRMFSAVARLRPGVSQPQAAAELKAIAAALEREHPRENSKWTITIAPLREEFAAFQRPLLLLLAAAVLVLLLASANVANLLLARAASRTAEIVVRSALGATRGDLVRQFLTESAVLAAAGTMLGVMVAQPLITFIATRRPASLPLWTDLALDGRVLVASVAAMVLSTLVAGLIPALAGSRNMDLAQLRTRSTAPAHTGMLRRLLAAGQVMLAVVLLVCATMLVRSLMALYGVNPGFETENRVAAVLELPDSQYNRTTELTLFASFLERVRSLPGVESAGASTSLPLHGFGVNYASEVYVEGAPPAPVAPEADIRLASPAYFATMGIPFVGGRDFASSDDARAPKVAIVNQEFVRVLAGGRDPMGRGAKLYCDDCPAFRIVGIVRNTRHHGLNAPLTPEIYVPYTQNPHGELTIVAKVTGNPMTVAAAMRRELVRLDPDLALAHVSTLEEIVARSAGQTRFNALLLAAFSGCALLLAAIGIYGSLSFSISQRQRDIAIRVAVGADRGRVWRLVFAEAARPVAWGVVAGTLASIGAVNAIRSMMFGVSPADPISYGLVIATFAFVVFVVSAMGFRRAAATDVRALLADA